MNKVINSFLILLTAIVCVAFLADLETKQENNNAANAKWRTEMENQIKELQGQRILIPLQKGQKNCFVGFDDTPFCSELVGDYPASIPEAIRLLIDSGSYKYVMEKDQSKKVPAHLTK